MAALDQGGCPITYVFTQLFTRENLAGAAVIAAIYIVCILFALRCSKKRAAALAAEEDE